MRSQAFLIFEYNPHRCQAVLLLRQCPASFLLEYLYSSGQICLPRLIKSFHIVFVCRMAAHRTGFILELLDIFSPFR